MFYKNNPIKLVDSREHGAGAELFIVEGDSAASAIAALRDGRFQAVLPMQGKPLNAIKASAAKTATYPLFQALEQAVFGSNFDSNTNMNIDLFKTKARFERIVLLFDPDADGIHSSALMLMYFYQSARLRPLLDAGQILIVHAPWMQITDHTTGEITYTYSEPQSKAAIAQLTRQQIPHQTTRYRGLAGQGHDLLIQTCIAPDTRNSIILNAKDAEMAIGIFGNKNVKAKVNSSKVKP